MNTVAVAMKSETLLHLEDDRRAEERSRLNYVDLPQTGLTDGQNTDLLQYQDTSKNSSTIKYRRYGSRLGGVKVRHKRQVLQDMARPLKHWLYKHRDNPYPTKTEKVLLALGSHMTLVQVSNWFANARRRLKNTVRQPDLSWALRIKLYNKYIQGNAERLSVCSDDTDSDDEECPLQTPIGQANFGRSSSHESALEKRGSVLAMADSANSDDGASPPSKYKSSLLNRYLNDTLRHMMASEADGVASSRKRRSHSESFSSNECDRDVASPASSYETDTNFVYHMETVDYTPTNCDRNQTEARGQQRRDDQGWREIHAAVALTNLAQGQSRAGEMGSGAVQSCTRGPFSVTTTTTAAAIMDRMHVAGPTSSQRQSCTAGPTSSQRQSCMAGPTSAPRPSCTTGPTSAPRPSCTAGPTSAPRQSCTAGPTSAPRPSCIIQKSSHIAEVQTVQVEVGTRAPGP